MIDDRKPIPPSPWQELPEASAYSRMSIPSLRRLIAANKLTAYRPLRGRILINIHELDALIASSTTAPHKRRGRYTRS